MYLGTSRNNPSDHIGGFTFNSSELLNNVTVPSDEISEKLEITLPISSEELLLNHLM
jgi:hypothetical protein